MNGLRPRVREALGHLDEFRSRWGALSGWPEAEDALRAQIWSERTALARSDRRNVLVRLAEHALERALASAATAAERDAAFELLEAVLVALAGGRAGAEASIGALCRALRRRVDRRGFGLRSDAQATRGRS